MTNHSVNHATVLRSAGQGVAFAVCVVIGLCWPVPPALRASGVVIDEGFAPQIEPAGGLGSLDGVNAIALQPDGKILIGGRFRSVDGIAQSHLARLHPDGTLDGSFQTEPISYWMFGGESTETTVDTVACQADGRILIGGFFNYVGDTSQRFLARLHSDGRLDTSFLPYFDDRVYSVAVQSDGKILAGGEFTQVDFQPHERLVRLNAEGSIDAGFQFSGASGAVRTVTVREDGRIVLAGGFSEITESNPNRPLLARLNPDGTLDQGFGLDTDPMLFTLAPRIYSLAFLEDGRVIIGGDFAIFGTNRICIARLAPDGSTDQGFAPEGANSWVATVLVQPDGKLVIGGRFSSVNQTPRIRLARLHADGTVDADFLPDVAGADGNVHALARDDAGGILLGGTFNEVMGKPRTFLARLAPAEPSVPVSMTVAPASITNDYRGKVSLDLNGLAPGHTIDLDIYVDENGDRELSSGEFPVFHASITDGVFPMLGGRTSPTAMGDDDGVANGRITTGLDLSRPTEIDGVAGAYIIRASSPTGSFTPLTRAFEVFKKANSQGVRGVVKAHTSGLGVSGAMVSLFDLFSNRVEAAQFTDASGEFELFCEPGVYLLLCLRQGLTSTLRLGSLAEFEWFVVPADQFITAELSLRETDRTLSGVVVDAATGSGIAGIPVFAFSNGGAAPEEDADLDLSMSFTDVEGRFDLAMRAGVARLSLPSRVLARRDYLNVEQFPEADLQDGDVSGLSLLLPKANALIMGRLLTESGTPMAGVEIDATEADIGNETSAITDQDGNYALVAVAGSWKLAPKDGLLAQVREDAIATVAVQDGEMRLHEFLIPLSETPVLLRGRLRSDGPFELLFAGPLGGRYRIEASDNLADWQTLRAFDLKSWIFPFNDSEAPNYRARFYRVVAE